MSGVGTEISRAIAHSVNEEDEQLIRIVPVESTGKCENCSFAGWKDGRRECTRVVAPDSGVTSPSMSERIWVRVDFANGESP
jgi:hypothetical protein